MTANRLSLNRWFLVLLSRIAPLVVLAFASATALAQADPPARAGSLSHIEGSVVLAPAGDTEWSDAVLNRPVTRGDRLWTDQGGRAEVHLGSAVLHLDDETFVDVTALDQDVLQASLNEGTVNARVRQLNPGENFEIDTPNLAFRAAQPGDYRIDVDPDRATTRVAVRSGMAIVYGASGQGQQVPAGQQITFAGRDLEQVVVHGLPPDDGFDRWAADRNQREDRAIAARYVPREVVGYHQLDPYGSWAHDPSYGDIWFPRVAIADWAPYRYGRWEWIRPWGWTWIDDAPWGFAPFHYGRWALVGSRWAWVPGRLGPRPVYAPALVVFVGGDGSSGWNFSAGSGPGIAWYPLAPGETWRPFFHASPVYVRNVNRSIVVRGGASQPGHIHRRRANAVTAVGVEDFSRGRPVHRHWTRVNPAEIARAPIAAPATLPEPRRSSGAARSVQPRIQPPVQSPAPAIIARPPWGAPGAERRVPGDQGGRPGVRSREERRQQPPPRRQEEPRSLIETPRGQPHVRQQERREDRLQERRARDEQRRQQLDQLRLQQQERTRRDQRVMQERTRREQMQAQQQVEEQRRAQQMQLQRERSLRQQQAAQDRTRQQQEMRERAARQQQEAQERAARQQHRATPPDWQRQLGGAPAVQDAQPRRGGPEWRGDRREQAQERREQRRSRGEPEGRGRGRDQGQWR